MSVGVTHSNGALVVFYQEFTNDTDSIQTICLSSDPSEPALHSSFSPPSHSDSSQEPDSNLEPDALELDDAVSRRRLPARVPSLF